MPKRQLNARLSELTHQQIAALQQLYGLNQTDVIVMAVDRMYHDAERGGSWERAEAQERVAEIAESE